VPCAHDQYLISVAPQFAARRGRDGVVATRPPAVIPVKFQ
jgi:hypothetical protein